YDLSTRWASRGMGQWTGLAQRPRPVPIEEHRRSDDPGCDEGGPTHGQHHTHWRAGEKVERHRYAVTDHEIDDDESGCSPDIPPHNVVAEVDGAQRPNVRHHHRVLRK